MATRVSCAPEEMIISLFMCQTPAAVDADYSAAEHAKHVAAEHAENGAAEHAEYAEYQQKNGSRTGAGLLMIHIQRTPRLPRHRSSRIPRHRRPRIPRPVVRAIRGPNL